MRLTTWLTMGAAATVASASVAASAVLYRGSLFADQESMLVAFLMRRKGIRKATGDGEVASRSSGKADAATSKSSGTQRGAATR